MHSVPASSSRILYDTPCAVCRDHSSGKHYGVYACDGCAGFFKRSVRRDRRYTCKARIQGACLVDKTHRNQCRSCRLEKCISVGMNRDAVQHERGPRNSTIRRQMALFLKDSPPPADNRTSAPPPMDLGVPKLNLLPLQPLPLFDPYTYPSLGLMTSPIIGPAPPPHPPSPPLSSPLLMQTTPAAVCEAAARLLFLNVKWAKNIPAFIDIPFEDRILLLEASWKDLFVIGSVQFLYPMNFSIVLDRHNARIKKSDVDSLEAVRDEIAKLRPDINEYACLRAILLFRTNIMDQQSSTLREGTEPRSLRNIAKVAAVQAHSIYTLNTYCARMYPLHPDRSRRLQNVLPIIRSVPSFIIVELFFRSTIGDIPVERILGDMQRNLSLVD